MYVTQEVWGFRVVLGGKPSRPQNSGLRVGVIRDLRGYLGVI